ncbi:MAG: DUF5655 domain-containing protein [Acidimicrobiia bacterium]|nr:DUF5655 domain-containing protein [Acidimicrobiia bacterium]
MWTCSECGRTFLNSHQWHSCIDLALEEKLETATGRAVAMYRVVEAAVRRCGEFRIHPQKSRIAFISVMTFAGVRLANDWVDVSFIAPTPIDDEKIRSVTCYGPTSFAHTVRIADAADVDDRVCEWLCIAKRRGDQDTLDPQAMVEPVTGRVLDRLSVPVRAEVVTRAGRLVLKPPRYALDVFELQPALQASVRGDVIDATAEFSDGDGWIDCDPALEHVGLGEGDLVDVTLRAAL